jgi:hypothetical protein
MSEPSLQFRSRRIAELWPLTILSMGIIVTFVWTAVLAWLMVCAFGKIF